MTNEQFSTIYQIIAEAQPEATVGAVSDVLIRLDNYNQCGRLRLLSQAFGDMKVSDFAEMLAKIERTLRRL